MVLTSIALKHLPVKSIFTTLRQYVPSRSTAALWVVVLLCVCILSMALFYVMARFRYPFWSVQPVAQPTLLPAADGRVHTVWTAMWYPPSPPEVPEGYVVERVKIGDTRHSKQRHLHNRSREVSQNVSQEVFLLWAMSTQQNPSTVDVDDASSSPPSIGSTSSTGSPVPISAWTRARYEAYTRSPGAQLFLVRDTTTPSSPALVATLLCTPTTLDTPIEEGLDVFVGDQLYVHPDHRGKGLVPVLIAEAVGVAREQNKRRLSASTSSSSSSSSSSPQHEPVGLFAVELDLNQPGRGGLPFSEVGCNVRVYQTIVPALLEDPSSDVAHKRVRQMKQLPSKAFESSGVRTHGNTVTLEPSASSDTRKQFWAHLLRHPECHTVLSVGGQDWIHLTHDPVAGPDGQPDRSHHVVQLLGCSFDLSHCDQLPAHVYAFLRNRYSTDSHVRTVTFVLAQPLQLVFERYTKAFASSRERVDDTTPEDSAHSAQTDNEEDSSISNDPMKWRWYDAHNLYMYNYRLRRRLLDIPFTFNVPVM